MAPFNRNPNLTVPNFTRVHDLSRLLHVCFAVHDLSRKGKVASAKLVGAYLKANKLSTDSNGKPQDGIYRRARDHLFSCVVLRLLKRVEDQAPESNKQAHFYELTDLGQLIVKEREFLVQMRDPNFLAVWVYAVMTCKFTSGWDRKRTYEEYRFRPAYFILSALSKKGLNLYQIHALVALVKRDPELSRAHFEKVLNRVGKNIYSADKQNPNRFLSDFAFTKATVKEAKRSIAPLLDWLSTLNLVSESERVFQITKSGSKVLKFFRTHMPIWFEDLHEATRVEVSALVQVIEEQTNVKVLFTPRTLEMRVRIPNVLLPTLKIRNLCDEIIKASGLKNIRELAKAANRFDFIVDTDVPVEFRADVKDIINPLRELADSRAGNRTDSLERKLFSLSKLVSPQDRIDQEKNRAEAKGRELLKSIGFACDFYKGDFYSERTHNLAGTFFKKNPDLLMTIESNLCLVECKSAKEWSLNSSGLQKRVESEVSEYQKNFRKISNLQKNVSSVVFLVESEDVNEKSYNTLVRLLRESKDTIFLSFGYLTRLKKKKRNREAETDLLKQKIKNPSNFSAEDRIVFLERFDLSEHLVAA